VGTLAAASGAFATRLTPGCLGRVRPRWSTRLRGRRPGARLALQKPAPLANRTMVVFGAPLPAGGGPGGLVLRRRKLALAFRLWLWHGRPFLLGAKGPKSETPPTLISSPRVEAPTLALPHAGLTRRGFSIWGAASGQAGPVFQYVPQARLQFRSEHCQRIFAGSNGFRLFTWAKGGFTLRRVHGTATGVATRLRAPEIGSVRLFTAKDAKDAKKTLSGLSHRHARGRLHYY